MSKNHTTPPSSPATIPQLIVNSPYEEPNQYWQYDRDTRTFVSRQGRRPSGFYVAKVQDAPLFDDPGQFVAIKNVDAIRKRVAAWRNKGYPNATAISRRLLEHWHNPEHSTKHRLFFCQREAIETIIWYAEAPSHEKRNITIEQDGVLQRLCTKMATGTGKTLVMAMVIAWQILNRVSHGQPKKYSKTILVIAPGLTVKKRLSVLDPATSDNYYESLVPHALLDKLRQGNVLIHNWHRLMWESDEKLSKKLSVDKRGAKSDEAYVRDVLDTLARERNLIVINDEAHHAWRVPEGKVNYVRAKAIQDATKWVGALERIQRARGIITCYDFSATPFAPIPSRSASEQLFPWIISDFGLNDAIESGLVKTPRVVVRSDSGIDAATYKPKLYHIYGDKEVRDDLNRNAKPHEQLPDLVCEAYNLLSADWFETKEQWEKNKADTPPVIISIANRTETAARIKDSCIHQRGIHNPALSNEDKTLHIDSKVLEAAEAANDANGHSKNTKNKQAEDLRQQVDTVGKVGMPGAPIYHVISVDMLSEGWDAQTVTHIIGLRAFSSQLLCEQVVGRGLRRVAYETNDEGLFDAEYVNVFGVPFSFLPLEGDTPTKTGSLTGLNKTRVYVMPERNDKKITWPNVVRIEHSYRNKLTVTWKKVETLTLNTDDVPELVELAPVIDGKEKCDVHLIKEVDLKNLARKYRQQQVIYETVRDIYQDIKPGWQGAPPLLLAQLLPIVRKFIDSDKIIITPESYNTNPLRRRLVTILRMSHIVRHLWRALTEQNDKKSHLVLDPSNSIGSTAKMHDWWTGKPCHKTRKSHINVSIYDSTWEAKVAMLLDKDKNVEAWVKNDHIDFTIFYHHRGSVARYYPDFLVRLTNGTTLILEVKGRQNAKDEDKFASAEYWVEAVNADKRYGHWRFAVITERASLLDAIQQAMKP